MGANGEGSACGRPYFLLLDRKYGKRTSQRGMLSRPSLETPSMPLRKMPRFYDISASPSAHPLRWRCCSDNLKISAAQPRLRSAAAYFPAKRAPPLRVSASFIPSGFQRAAALWSLFGYFRAIPKVPRCRSSETLTPETPTVYASKRSRSIHSPSAGLGMKYISSPSTVL